MKKNGFKGCFCSRKAFTLIELLVVVLIIGILAAVAVPQYQKAIYKSRATEALAMLKAIVQAEEVYYLANGEYTNDISKLDVEVPSELITTEEGEFPENRYAYYCRTTQEGFAYCEASSRNANMPDYEMHALHEKGALEPLAGKYFCHVTSSGSKNDIAKAICQSMGPLDTSMDKSWFVGNYFRLN